MMITIRELLNKNSLETTDVSQAILNTLVHETSTVQTIGEQRFDLFKAYQITDGYSLITINLDDNEFAKYCVQDVDLDGDIVRETGYDENKKLIYTFEN